MALRHEDIGICERCRRAVPLAQLGDRGVCGACAVSERGAPEMAMAASLDMEAIVRHAVEAGMRDWLHRGLKPNEKTARDRLGDLGKAVKAVPIPPMKDARVAEHLKGRALETIRAAKGTVSARRKPRVRPVEVATNNVLAYFQDLLSPVRTIEFGHDAQLRPALDAVRAALPPALDAVRALAA